MIANLKVWKAKTIPEGYYGPDSNLEKSRLVGLDPANPQTIALLEDEGLTRAEYVYKLHMVNYNDPPHIEPVDPPYYTVDENPPFIKRC